MNSPNMELSQMTTLILNLEIEYDRQDFSTSQKGFNQFGPSRTVYVALGLVQKSQLWRCCSRNQPLTRFVSRYWMHDLRFLAEQLSLVYRRRVVTGATVWRTYGVCFSVLSFHFDCNGLSVPLLSQKQFRTSLWVSRSVDMVCRWTYAWGWVKVGLKRATKFFGFSFIIGLFFSLSTLFCGAGFT